MSDLPSLQFTGWTEEIIAKPGPDRSSMVAAFAVMAMLPAEQSAALLRTRAIALEDEMAKLEANVEISGLPRQLKWEADFQRALWKAEIAFVRDLADELETDSLT